MINYVPRKNSSVLLLTSCNAKLKVDNQYIMLMLYFIIEMFMNNTFLLMRHQQSYQKTKKRFMRELSAHLVKQHIEMRYQNQNLCINLTCLHPLQTAPKS
ncbi:hypothetical protein T09_14352 [Trichinella sp. T9]|nr:hypothetical protein T09_14352 [Trichinella sp. T9]